MTVSNGPVLLGQPLSLKLVREFMESVPDMVRKARYAAENDSYSYRNFKVGASVFALTQGTQNSDIFSSGNLKIWDGREKVCAEKIALNKAKSVGHTAVLGIVVVGSSDRGKIAEVTPFATPTLHPCTTCQSEFVDHPLMRDDTLVITTGLDTDYYQVHTAGELTELYIAENAEALNVVSPSLSGWSRRVKTFETLAAAETTAQPKQQRSLPMLAQLALKMPKP